MNRFTGDIVIYKVVGEDRLRADVLDSNETYHTISGKYPLLARFPVDVALADVRENEIAVLEDLLKEQDAEHEMKRNLLLGQIESVRAIEHKGE